MNLTESSSMTCNPRIRCICVYRLSNICPEKVTPKQCTIEMLNLNASCPYFVHFILNNFWKIHKSYIWNYCMIACRVINCEISQKAMDTRTVRLSLNELWRKTDTDATVKRKRGSERKRTISTNEDALEPNSETGRSQSLVLKRGTTYHNQSTLLTV